MPIDFFVKPCTKLDCKSLLPNVDCSSRIDNNRFGISDAEANMQLPAKVLIANDHLWDFAVSNPNRLEVLFKAIDYCVDIYRTGTYDLANENRNPANFSSVNTYHAGAQLIKRCEGLIQFNDKILFIEIKRRPRGNWLSDAREKFEETILSFKEHHPLLSGQIIEPIVSNMLFNRAHQSEMVQKRMLKDKVGLDFKIQQSISI
jgi:hypothetical protein